MCYCNISNTEGLIRLLFAYNALPLNFITSKKIFMSGLFLPLLQCLTCLSDSCASQVLSSISLRWEGGASRTFRNRSWAWRPQCWQMPCSASSTRKRMYGWLERNWNSSWHLWVGKHIHLPLQQKKVVTVIFYCSYDSAERCRGAHQCVEVWSNPGIE